MYVVVFFFILFLYFGCFSLQELIAIHIPCSGKVVGMNLIRGASTVKIKCHIPVCVYGERPLYGDKRGFYHKIKCSRGRIINLCMKYLCKE